MNRADYFFLSFVFFLFCWFVLQSRHATVSFEDMLETLKRSAYEKVVACFASYLSRLMYFPFFIW